jgi:hypothetical protein
MLKIALYTLSLLNTGFGLFLSGAFLFANRDGGIPLVAFLVGVALVVQGAYTIGYAGGVFDDLHELGTQLFVAGQTLSVLAGGLAAVQGYLYNLHPRNGDYEFGPMGLGVFMAVQAIVGLFYASSTSSDRSPDTIH